MTDFIDRDCDNCVFHDERCLRWDCNYVSRESVEKMLEQQPCRPKDCDGMAREEAIKIIRQEYKCVDAECDIERNCGKCEYHMPSKEPILKAYEMAIQALSQEPTDENLHREREQAYMQGYEDASKRFRPEPCEDAEQIDYHDDFETASRKMHDYEERQKQNDKKCGSYNNTNTFKSCCECKLIGTDSCFMVCGGSKSLYKPKQKPEPCDDAISREYLKKIAQSEGAYGYVSAYDIATAPSVTPSRHKGHWIKDDPTVTEPYICSECGMFYNGKYRNFCPNCGARMVEPQESEV